MQSSTRGLVALLLYAAAGHAAAAEPGALQSLVSGATYELSTFSAYYPMDLSRADADDDAVGLWSRLMMTSQTDFTESLRLKVKMYGVFSNSDGDHGGAFTAPHQTSTRARYVDFARLALSYDADDFAVTVGRSELSSGLATLYSPADRYETTYGAMPMHVFKTGVWQARLDVPIEDDTVTFAVVPYDNRSSVPNRKSRWVGNSGSFLFSGLNIGANTELDEPFRDSEPDDWGYLIKYKAARSGYDFFASAHHGPAAYPVVLHRTPLDRFAIAYPIANTVAGGPAVTIDHWEVHGEASYQNTLHDADQDFGKYVVGASYRDSDLAGWLGWEEIQPIVEYAGEWITSKRQDRAFAATSVTARPYRDAMLARIEARFDDAWRVLVGGSYNLVDRDSTVAAGLEYKHTDNLTFLLSLRHFNGDSDTQFGRWRRNDHVEAGLEWKF